MFTDTVLKRAELEGDIEDFKLGMLLPKID